MKVLHFGAGNIGRAFIGKVLADAGCHVTFVDLNAAVIKSLHENKQYQVRLVADGIDRLETVKNVDGIMADNQEALQQLAPEIDLITTAVGLNILPHLLNNLIAVLQARAEAKNHKNLNIIACENAIRASSTLKNLLCEKLSAPEQEILLKNVAFVDCAVDRIVPPVTGDDVLTAEVFNEWIVDARQYLGEFPQIEGMIPSDNLSAFIERKLLTLNTGHATAAYLAHLQNYPSIQEALHDEKIYIATGATMRESGAVLCQRYGFAPEDHEAYIQKILARFLNPFLHDEVERVARDPMRKLSPQDRLIKPLNGTLEYDLPHHHLLTAIAAALAYRDENDTGAVKMAQEINELGLEQFLRQHCQLQQDEVIQQIIEIYKKINN